MEAVFTCKQQKLVNVAAKKLQHACLLAIFWSFKPADIFEQRWIRIFVALEHGRCHVMKLRNLPKERGKNVGVVNPEVVLNFPFEYKVDILPYFGRFNKAAHTELSGCLREGGGKGGAGLSRGCGFGDDYGRVDSGVGFVPDGLVWLFAEDCF